MEKDSKIRVPVSALLVGVISLALTYGYECLICFMDSREFTFKMFLVMLLLSGIPLTLVLIIFSAISFNIRQRDPKEVCLTLIAASVMFDVSMFVIFPHLPVPYALIPSGEMAMGFLQLLIGIFASIPGGIFILGSLIVLVSGKADTKK